eukprot:14568288-Alexandrium_andersonii.AAC.1
MNPVPLNRPSRAWGLCQRSRTPFLLPFRRPTKRLCGWVHGPRQRHWQQHSPGVCRRQQHSPG